MVCEELPFGAEDAEFSQRLKSAGIKIKYLPEMIVFHAPCGSFIDFLKKTSYQNAKDVLLDVYGIGNKVADCIMLFSLEKLDAFPIDRWVLKILKKYYSDKFQIDGKSLTEKKYDQIHEKIVNHFGPYAGYAQQFLFKMERELNKKRWL